MTQLVALGAMLDVPVDLNDVAGGNGHLFVRDGVGVAGQGQALCVPASRVSQVLTQVDLLDSVAHPIAIGAIPFRSEQDGDFVIPATTVEKSHDGSTRLTAIGPDKTSAQRTLESSLQQLAGASRQPAASANSFSVAPLTPIDTYLAAVTKARDAVRAGRLTKAVIARDIVVTSDQPIDLHAVLLRLKASFGSSYRYSFRNFVGASPELLVQVDHGTLRSHPLAGTTPRTGDPATDIRMAEELLASEKNQIEHRVVVDMVHDTLLPFCSYLDWEPEPSVVPVANVQHLGTRVEGRLNQDVHCIDLARLLSPTPALGGFPRTEALELIAGCEGMDRGLYGGTIGWCDAAGNGTFAVSIRCALFNDDRTMARLFAGGGIVAESEPYSELAETQAKFQAMLSAIIRP
ncbi:MAG: hypothetical protein RJB08_504 [Actinomycetota bacterium]|jgi:menaquinone-specific isochorismate synthase